MREKDLNRVYKHVAYHEAGPRRDAMRGVKILWSYIRFARWAIPKLIYSGWLDLDGGKPAPGGSPLPDRRDGP